MFADSLRYTIALDSLGNATRDEIDAFCQSLAVSLAAEFPSADPHVVIGQFRAVSGTAIKRPEDREAAVACAARCWDNLH